MRRAFLAWLIAVALGLATPASSQAEFPIGRDRAEPAFFISAVDDSVEPGSTPTSQERDVAYDLDGRRLWLRAEPLITVADVENAHSGLNRDLGLYTVVVRFSPRGRQLLADFSARHVGRRMAVVLDGKVLAAAVILEPIQGGEIEITTSNLNGATAEEIVERIELLVKSRTEISCLGGEGFTFGLPFRSHGCMIFETPAGSRTVFGGRDAAACGSMEKPNSSC